MSDATPTFSQTIKKYKSALNSIAAFFRAIQIERAVPFILVFAVLYYIIIFSSYSILLHQTFATQAFDAGIDDQATWLLSRFLTPFVTVRGLNTFGDSVTLYHFFAAALFWLWNNINILFIFQAFFIGLGTVPLFFLARDRLSSAPLALIIAIAYLLFPALQNMNLEQYHPEAIAVFFLLLTFYAINKGNWRLFFPALLLTIIAKDEVALTGLFLGLWLVFSRKNARTGFATVAICLAWFFLCSRILMPWFNGVGIFAPQPITYSHWFRGLTANLFNPGFYLANIFHPESLTYYFHLFFPVAFIPFLSPAALFILIPSMAVNVLSGCGYLRSIFYHYNYIQSAVIFFGLVEGIYLMKRKNFPVLQFIAPAILILIFSVSANLTLSQLPLSRQWKMIAEKVDLLSSDEIKAKQAALELIPGNAKVSASYSFVPHLSHRREIYMFPNPFKQMLWDQWFQEGKGIPPAAGHVEYIAVDITNLGEEERAILHYLGASRHFKTIFHDGEIMVLKAAVNMVDPDQGATLAPSRVIHSLYFPSSNYYMRTLMGEDLTSPRPLELDISGYLFIPETNQYLFWHNASGACQMEIDGKIAAGMQKLQFGFHPYRLKYTNESGPFALRLRLIPANGKAYIIPDQHLMRRKDPKKFNQFIVRYLKEKQERENLLRRQSNLVRNGGFESGLGQDIPTNWRIECWQDAGSTFDYKLDSSVKKSGNYSAKIEHQGKADSRLVQEINVKPSTRYRLSGWIKTVGVPKESAGAFIQIEETDLRTEAIPGTQDWKQVETVGRTGRNQNRIKILCRLGYYGATTTGTAYFDDVELKELPPDE